MTRDAMTRDERLTAARAQYARARTGVAALLYVRNRLTAEAFFGRDLAAVDRDLADAKATLAALREVVSVLERQRLRAVANGFAMRVAVELEVEAVTSRGAES